MEVPTAFYSALVAGDSTRFSAPTPVVPDSKPCALLIPFDGLKSLYKNNSDSRGRLSNCYNSASPHANIMREPNADLFES